MNKHANIYVAGHRGLAGSAIVRRLRAAGYENIVTRTSHDLDLRDKPAVTAFFEAERPEYVFLAAAKVGGIWANATYPAQFLYDNLQITSNIIHAAHLVGVKRLLNLGSSCIYPKLETPLKESDLLTGRLEPTNEGLRHRQNRGRQDVPNVQPRIRARVRHHLLFGDAAQPLRRGR